MTMSYFVKKIQQRPCCFWKLLIIPVSHLAGPTVLTLTMAAVHIWAENKQKTSARTVDELRSGTYCIYNCILVLEHAAGQRHRFRHAVRTCNENQDAEVKTRLCLKGLQQLVKSQLEFYRWIELGQGVAGKKRGKWMESWSPVPSARKPLFH